MNKFFFLLALIASCPANTACISKVPARDKVQVWYLCMIATTLCAEGIEALTEDRAPSVKNFLTTLACETAFLPPLRYLYETAKKPRKALFFLTLATHALVQHVEALKNLPHEISRHGLSTTIKRALLSYKRTTSIIRVAGPYALYEYLMEVHFNRKNHILRTRLAF